MTDEVRKEDITEDFIIDRQPVPLAFCAHPTAKNTLESTLKPPTDVVSEIMEIIDPITVENPGEIRKAESIKSYGCETESEFELSGDESDLEDLDDLKSNALNSDDEFDKLVHLSAKILEKTHKAEYPDENCGRKTRKSQKSQKTPNIREYDDMPPLENLSIECRSSLIEFGFVSKVVDCMVVIESTSTEVLDFDSFLFDHSGKAVGQVYDIFGQVKSPQYAIRFNSSEEAHLIPINMKVFYAPNEEQFSKTPFKGLNLAAVNRESIRKMNRQLDQEDAIKKAGDASMNDDIGSDVEFSDDEAEKAFRNTRNASAQQNRPRNDRGGRKRDRRGAQTVRFAPSGPSAPIAQNAPRAPAPPSADFSNPYAEFGCYPTFHQRFGS